MNWRIEPKMIVYGETPGELKEIPASWHKAKGSVEIRIPIWKLIAGAIVGGLLGLYFFQD